MTFAPTVLFACRHCFPAIAVIVCCSGLLFAQDDLIAVPNRPTVSTPAQPVQPGVLETEWGVDAAASHQDVNGLFKFGVSKNFELRLAGFPFTADSGHHGFGDSALGFKYRFTQDYGQMPSLAFIYMLKVPTAGEVRGSGQIDHSLIALASKNLGKHHFDFNLVANLLGRPRGGFEYMFLNALAWSHPVRGKWGATAELFGTTSPNAFTPASAQILASATCTVRPRLVLDFGMVGRITGNVPHAMFIAGFTYSIVDFYRDRR
jgi:hypothetical protein